MIMRTNIEPARREAAFRMALTATRVVRIEPHIKPPKIRERWLAVVGSEDANAQSLRFVRRFAKNDDEIRSVTTSGTDPASGVHGLAMEHGVHWLCMLAHRGSLVVPHFLLGEVERTLRASPCPVICIPEHGELRKDRHEVLSRVRRRHRRRNWHTPSRLSLSHGLRPFPKRKDFSAMRNELVAPTINPKRFDPYETKNTDSR